MENLKFLIDDTIYSDKYVRIDIYEQDETDKNKKKSVECYALISDVISMFTYLPANRTVLNWDQISYGEYSDSSSIRSNDDDQFEYSPEFPVSRGESSENPPGNSDESSKKTTAIIASIDYMSVYNNYITSNAEYSLLTDIFAIIGAKISKRPADKKHPLGHGKAEYITCLFIGFIIFQFNITSLGIVLSTFANNTAQLALLIILVMMPMTFLSGMYTPMESMAPFIQKLMFLSPLKHCMDFSFAVIFRGATLKEAWKPIVWMLSMGTGLFIFSSLRFNRWFNNNNR